MVGTELAVAVDLNQASPRVLRHLRRENDRQVLVELATKLTGQAKDIVVSVMGAIKDNNLALLVALFVMVYGLIRVKLLDKATGSVVLGVILGAMGVEAVLPDWLT